MKIIHYFLGFPPYRTGGLTKYAIDLMQSQSQDNNDVIAIWPGKMKMLRSNVQLKRRKKNQQIENYELINPLPVPLDEGIKDISQFVKKITKDIYKEFLKKEKPDVIHFHTLMGIHKEFIESAKEQNIKMVFTTHDYFGICPKVTLYKEDGACSNDNNCNDCVACNKNALSINQIRLLQSPIYRIFKNNILIKKIRKAHRKKFFLKNTSEKKKKELNITGREYIQLREYYISMLKLIDIIHFNSTLTKEIYEKYFIPNQSKVINITHKDIKNNIKEVVQTSNTGKIKLVYLSPAKPFKGYNILKEALDQLWEEKNRRFELKVFEQINDLSPYMKVIGNQFNYKELDKIMSDVDILLAPSIWYETFGFTVLEALSFGVPVIISDNVGAKDIVQDGGIIVKAGNLDSLKKEIEQLTEEKIKIMRNNIKEHIQIKAWNEFVREIYELYNIK